MIGNHRFFIPFLTPMTVVVVLVLSMGQHTHAGTTGLGKQIKFYEENGRAKFGVQINRNPSPSPSADPEYMWAISFSVPGAELSEGKPLRVIAWRLWDQRNETFLSEWRTQVETVSDTYYSGTAAFSWETAIPSVVFEAIQNSAKLTLVISATHRSRPGQPTHFIDLGTYCSSAPSHFLNLTTGQSGCSTLAKPTQPARLPDTQGKVKEILWVADTYCETVSRLDQDFQKIAGTQIGLPLGVKGQMTKELKFAKVVCDRKTDKFVGFKEIKDTNVRAIANMAAVEAGFFRLSTMARETSPALHSSTVATNARFKEDKTIFFSESLHAAYPDLTRDPLWKTYHAIETWAVDLSNYYRNQ